MADHNIFLSIFLLIFLILPNASKDLGFLQNFLTLNNSLDWFRNETHNSGSRNPYCSICCFNTKYGEKGRKCGVHTMCVYEKDKPGPACKGLIPIKLSIEEIASIVDAHNTLRNRVALGEERSGNPGPQPAAANMRMMSWDQELADISLRWAEQCVFAHDFCRDLERFPVGQNVARGGYGVKNNLEFIKDWYLNVADFDNSQIKQYRLYKDGEIPLAHYTQLVWADTYLVGCARVAFQKSHEASVFYREHFFCNYGPSGNIIVEKFLGQSVYKIGESCSFCLEGTGCTSVEYPGLCGNEILDNEALERKTKLVKQRHSSNTGLTLEKALGNWITYYVVILIVFRCLVVLQEQQK